LHDDDLLRDDALELVVDEERAVELVVDVLGEVGVGDLAHPVEGEVLEDPHVLLQGGLVDLAEVVAALAANDRDLDVVVARLLLPQEALGAPRDVAVEASREPAVRGDDDEEDAPRVGVGHQERVLVEVVRAHPRREPAHDLTELLRVGTRRDHPLLGALQLRGGHHLHGLGDLLGVLDAADALADVAQRRHGALPFTRPRRA
jgi:hypothetical protein